jgi:hypothetical protein
VTETNVEKKECHRELVTHGAPGAAPEPLREGEAANHPTPGRISAHDLPNNRGTEEESAAGVHN